MRRKLLSVMAAAALLFALPLAGCSSDSGEESLSVSGDSSSDEETETVKTDLDAEVKTDMDDDEETIQDELIEGLIYDTDAQAAVKAELDEMKTEDDYTPDNILVQYNPFGSNTLSLYIYFETEEAADVSYTVHVDSDDIDDFTQSAWQDEEYQTEHEFQVIGLIPDMENTVTFTILYEDGTSEESEITYEMGSLLGDEEVCLEVTEGSSSAQLEDGLYVILGNDSNQLDFMYYYDNNGVIRGEIPIVGYRSHRLLFEGDSIFFSISEYRFAEMNRLGQIVNVYNFGDYKLHHDYVFDDDGNILVLGTDTTTDTQEDVILLLDRETGEVSEIIDMEDLLGDYKEACYERYDEDDMDWVHLNTIQWLSDDEDSIIVSSRETSTIIKISGIYSEPYINWMIGSEDFWEGTGYEDLLLDQLGDFTLQGGQHTVTYLEDDTLEDGQYYLYLYNNNIGISTTNPDFDWSSIGLTISSAVDGDASYYYQYFVDENEGTFELVDSFEVAYSGYVSSVQNIGSNTVVDSGLAGYFAEYDENHELIAGFSMDTEKFIYRVYKYVLDE